MQVLWNFILMQKVNIDNNIFFPIPQILSLHTTPAFFFYPDFMILDKKWYIDIPGMTAFK